LLAALNVASLERLAEVAGLAIEDVRAAFKVFVGENADDVHLLRYVFLTDDEETLVNAEMVKMGYAQATPYPPDLRYQDLFLELQREAQEAKRGVWGPLSTPATDLSALAIPTSAPAPTSTPLIPTPSSTPTSLPTLTPSPTPTPSSTPAPLPTLTPSSTQMMEELQAWWRLLFTQPFLVEVMAGLISAVISGVAVGMMGFFVVAVPGILPRRLLSVARNTPPAIQERLAVLTDKLSIPETGVMGLVSAVSLSTLGVLSSIATFLGKVITPIGRWLAKGLHKLRVPKWYQSGVVVDPGLIEVALAVTALTTALPSIITSQGIELPQSAAFRAVLVLGVLIPAFTSITLLNLYAKGKGSKSRHILLSPIADGPFFLLGWSIVIGPIAIAITASISLG